jgi:hypothetical protein
MKSTLKMSSFYSFFSKKALFATGLLLTCLAPTAQAQFSIDGKSYVTHGNTETLTTAFDSPLGTVTTQRYKNLVLLEVKGVGQSPAENYNDAFYIYKGFFRQDSFFYQLGATTESSFHLNTASNVSKQVVFDALTGKTCGRDDVPAYQKDHVYSFVIDLALMPKAPKTPTNIRFGLTDGIYSDNSGVFTITISQLEEDTDTDCDKVLDICDRCPNNSDAVDNNRDGIADCSQLLDFSAYATAWKPSNNKIVVCNNGQTMTIAKDMLAARFAMGYRVGPCINCSATDRNDPNETTTDALAPVLSLAPNPATEVLNISLDKALDEEGTLSVFDNMGKLVYSQQWPSNTLQLRLDLLPNRFAAGFYTVQIATNNSVLSQKMTVVRL